MKTEPECLACFIKQAVLTARQVSDDPATIFAAVQEAARHFPALDPNLTPPENSRRLVEAVAAFLGKEDPFRETKARYNALALRGHDALRRYVQGAADPLEAAVRVSAAGNILDLSYFERVDVNALIDEVRRTGLAVNHYGRLRDDLAHARRVLMLGDNAGEIVFDLPLAELLRDKDLYYGVKAAPIANDVTAADAAQVGMDRFATVVSIGCAIQGAPLDRCSPEFRALFHSADVIIAKGQGNFETLDAVDANLYFIVRAKCAPTARALGVEVGQMVLLSQRARREGQERPGR